MAARARRQVRLELARGKVSNDSSSGAIKILTFASNNNNYYYFIYIRNYCRAK